MTDHDIPVDRSIETSTNISTFNSDTENESLTWINGTNQSQLLDVSSKPFPNESLSNNISKSVNTEFSKDWDNGDWYSNDLETTVETTQSIFSTIDTIFSNKNQTLVNTEITNNGASSEEDLTPIRISSVVLFIH